MRVYISGAITGTNDYMERFQKAENNLKKQGYSVINPARLNSVMGDDAEYEEYMKISLCMLCICDAIYMLEGWQQSRGANREFGYALARDIMIMKER